MKLYRNLAAPLTAIAFAIAWSGGAEAKQTSIDAVLGETVSNINKRNNNYEQSFQQKKAHIRRLQGEIAGLGKELNALSEGSAAQEEIISKLIEATADYLHQRYTILNASSAVIGDNLKDLYDLEDALVKSQNKTAKTIDPRARIEAKIADGRAMRKAATTLGNWAQTDRALGFHFKDLKRLMSTLDWTITLERRHLNAGQVTDGKSLRLRQQHQLSMAIERFSDTHARIEKSKELLMARRDQLEVTARYARLDMLLRLIDEGLPLYDDGLKFVPSFAGDTFEFDGVLDDVNKSIIGNKIMFDHSGTGSSSSEAVDQEDLSMPKYKNF